MKLRRVLSVVALVVVAAVGLTACDSKIGVAASVNGQTLTSSDLGSFVQPGTAPYRDSQTGATVIPKAYALETWIRTRLIAGAVAAKGGPPTPAELNAARSAVLNGSDISVPEQSYIKQGYTAKLADLVVDQNAYLLLLIERLLGHNATASDALAALQSRKIGDAQLLGAIHATNPQVIVSTRYGVWQPEKFSLKSGPGVGRPTFVQIAGG